MRKMPWLFLFCTVAVSAALTMTACESGGGDDDDAPVVPAVTNAPAAVVQDIWEGDLDVDMYTSQSTPFLVSPGNGFVFAQVMSEASDAPVTGVIVSTANGAPSANGSGWNFTMKGAAQLNTTWVVSVENPNRRSLTVHVKVWYSSQ